MPPNNSPSAFLPNFFHHPATLRYDFGGNHPLKPERLRRTLSLLDALKAYQPVHPGDGDLRDVQRVHSDDYIEAVQRLSDNPASLAKREYGFGTLDVPAFSGMFEASLAYVSSTAAAARAVASGARLAYGIAGGLHHALPAMASGFCIFNDPAIACHILLESFDRVAYIDIDVHHGDGVQEIFLEDPRVLTCSIHESPKTLWPGTGEVDETGVRLTALNVPLAAKTTGDVWIWAFREAILPTVEQFQPGAIVLQMGTDSHFLDPLGHLLNTAQDWLAAIRMVRDLAIPVVALGGGGYNMGTVPRMWGAACLVLAGHVPQERLPADLASEWGITSFFDEMVPGPTNSGRDHAEQAVAFIRENHLNHIAP